MPIVYASLRNGFAVLVDDKDADPLLFPQTSQPEGRGIDDCRRRRPTNLADLRHLVRTGGSMALATWSLDAIDNALAEACDDPYDNPQTQTDRINYLLDRRLQVMHA